MQCQWQSWWECLNGSVPAASGSSRFITMQINQYIHEPCMGQLRQRGAAPDSCAWLTCLFVFLSNKKWLEEGWFMVDWVPNHPPPMTPCTCAWKKTRDCSPSDSIRSGSELPAWQCQKILKKQIREECSDKQHMGTQPQLAPLCYIQYMYILYIGL